MIRTLLGIALAASVFAASTVAAPKPAEAIFAAPKPAEAIFGWLLTAHLVTAVVDALKK